MSSGFSDDPAVLLAGLLLLVGVVGGGVVSRLRIPSLLLFLGLGMLVADDGLALVRFDDAVLAQNIAAIALVIILFEGGLGTDPASLRDSPPPDGARVTVIRRGDRTVVPRGPTMLAAGDVVLLVTTRRSQLAEIEHWI